MDFARSIFLIPLLIVLLTTDNQRCNAMDDAIKEMIQSLHDACVEDTGVDESLIAAANNPGPLPDNQLLKCYMKCLMEEIGVLEGTTFDSEAFLDMLPDSMKTDVEPAIHNCKDTTGSDGCDLGYNLNACFKNFDPAHYMLF
uniref:Odorant binding protein 8 n=1 Tax=Drosicha corpulenta TaxID=535978 RepID=A0A0U3BFY8_9HEMI|nr:odorant binding protein 8 [Drosicha corpulenta]